MLVYIGNGTQNGLKQGIEIIPPCYRKPQYHVFLAGPLHHAPSRESLRGQQAQLAKARGSGLVGLGMSWAFGVQKGRGAEFRE